MRSVVVSTARVLGVVLGVALAASCPAQEKPPFHRMEIYNGPNRTVAYFGLDLSPGERAALRDLERTENDAAYADSLLALRRQYVNSELLLEPRRQTVQQVLYGRSIQRSLGAFAAGAAYGAGALGSFYPYYPYAYGYGSFGSGLGLSPGFALAASSTLSESLANGVGYEGAIKTEMARTIAAQAAPDYAAGTARASTNALANAAEYPKLRTGLGLPAAGAPEQPPRKVTVILKEKNEKVEGNLIREDAEWIRVETPTEEVDIRKADVARITRSKGK
jgi:hypothetical protein